MKYSFYFLIAIIFTLTTSFGTINNNSALLQDCNASLLVENNRNYRSANVKGSAIFRLLLKNTSTKSQTFILSTKQSANDCSNKRYKRKKNAKNVNLKVKLNIGLENSKTNRVTLSPGELFKFNVGVEVPKGTPYKEWNCIVVEAVSVDCNTISATTVLSTIVSNPNSK